MSERFNAGDKRAAEEIFSKTVRAGKRTYFFDIKPIKNNDFVMVLTERKELLEEHAFMKNRIYLYKEDVLNFMDALQETIDYLKTELLPEYDFENPRPGKPGNDFEPRNQG